MKKWKRDSNSNSPLHTPGQSQQLATVEYGKQDRTNSNDGGKHNTQLKCFSGFLEEEARQFMLDFGLWEATYFGCN